MNKKKTVNKPKQPKRALFWLTSSRGTDLKQVYDFRTYSKKEIEEACHEWAERVGPKTSESLIRFGFSLMKIRPRAEALKEFHRVCDLKRRIDNRYKKLVTELNPVKWQE